MGEERKKINMKYNQFILKELNRLDNEMEHRVIKYVAAFGRAQLKIQGAK